MSIRQSFPVGACNGLLPQSVCSWFSGGVFRDLLFETGGRLAFCLAAPLETINRPAQEQVQWSCVPECSLLCWELCWVREKKAAVKRWLLQWASTWGTWRWLYQLVIPPFPSSELSLGSLRSCFRKAQRRRLRGAEGSCSPQGLREHHHAVAVLQRSAGLGMLLSVPSWLGDEDNHQHCIRKHTSDLKKKCFRDFLLFVKLSLSTEFAHWPVFSSFLGCTLQDGAGLYDNQSCPLLWDNSCPVAMKHLHAM